MRQNTGRPGSELVWEEGPLRRSGAEVLLHLTISCYTTTDLQARELQRRRPIASGGSGGPPPGFGRAAENFFLRVHFHKRKKFRGRRFQDKSKICTFSRTLGGKLGAIQHKTTQTAPPLSVKRPHKSLIKPICKKAQEWTFIFVKNYPCFRHFELSKNHPCLWRFTA